MNLPVPPAGHTPVSVRGIVIFVILAVGLAWLICIPVWLTGGLASPWFTVLVGIMMFAPTISAGIVLRFVERRPWRSTADTPGILAAVGIPPSSPVKRWFGWLGIAWLLLLVLVVAAFAASALLGTWQPDFTELSAYTAALSAQGVPIDQVPVPVLAASQLIQAVTVVVLVNTFFTAGEEIGWRGFLYPALLARLPRGVALLAGGVIWGLWHTPVLLMGYNYGLVPAWLSLPMMCGFCVLTGTILAWLRMRSGSVWPAAVGHSVINSVSSAILITLSTVDAPPDPVLGTPLGLAGWIVLGIVALLLVWRGRWHTATAITR